MKAFQNFINGKYVDAADGRTSAVVNPATGEQYATAPLSGPAGKPPLGAPGPRRGDRSFGGGGPAP